LQIQKGNVLTKTGQILPPNQDCWKQSKRSTMATIKSETEVQVHLQPSCASEEVPRFLDRFEFQNGRIRALFVSQIDLHSNQL